MLFFEQQHHFDQLLVNMRMDGIFVKESMHIKWVAESGMVENIENIIKEYKETRNLLVSMLCLLVYYAIFLLVCYAVS